MLLASVVLAAQVAGASPPGRTDVARPCADPSLLCRISPFFCPGTYPPGLEPCWPEAPRETRTVSSRAADGTARGQRQSAGAANAPTRPSPIRGRSSD